MLSDLKRDLRKFSNPDKAKLLARFFKTGKGEYGEGDVFLGVMVPQTRTVAQKYRNLGFSDTTKLLRSPVHEERLCAILILVHNFQKGDLTAQKIIFNFYLRHTKYINNWDLVDLSASRIIGEYLYKQHPYNLKFVRMLLTRLARSRNLWTRRIAIISTFVFIQRGEPALTFKIAKILLNDEHDLIHKAVGWMLREVGKRCRMATEEKFLKRHYKKMPRTMLRYAIEKFPEAKRLAYLKGQI